MALTHHAPHHKGNRAMATTIRKVYGGDVCGTCHRWIPGMAPGRVTTPDAFCACPGITDAEALAKDDAHHLDQAVAAGVLAAPSIPERVTAVQDRLQALLDTVKIMSIQLGAWERAMTHRDEMFSTDDDQEEKPVGMSARIAEEDAETALLATIEKLEQGTY